MVPPSHKVTTLYERLGGAPTFQKVHKIFYDKVYKHPWIGLYFKEIKQELIENQQTDFMADAMGGPQNYSGKFPIPAHRHMYITEELFTLRTQLLTESLAEAGVPKDLAEQWLLIDGAFKRRLVKNSPAECEKRYATDEILNFPNPYKRAA